MSRARAVSEEPSTDAVKRSGDTSIDEFSSAKRPRLSDYRVLETFQLPQNRNFSGDSENGGVPYATTIAPTSVESEKTDVDDSTALIEGPNTEINCPHPPGNRAISVAEIPSSPAATQMPSTDFENRTEGNEPATGNFQDVEPSSEEEDSPVDSSNRCPTSSSGVDTEMGSVEDSQDMWTSVASSEDSEDEGVEIGFSGRLESAFSRPVSLPEQAIPAAVEEGFGTFKAHVEDAFASFKRDIESVLGVEEKRIIVIMKDILAEKDGIISLLKAEIDQLRSELEKCRQLVHQHGKETEEWADRMMNLICRLPDFEGV
ncbi:hypothetical protein PISL3812_05462 [Talaromyces islandicus]|uniref:Uncharacterized protein n=1 Tax=Talaromyces islandicus TaxID=28573 RepID=A0A0U1LZA1_TALIS|nr:hypothetical protein PISL3812_05462 [Talaromyces islandicus]